MLDSPSAKRARIFISYKHKVEPDQSVVDQVVQTLEPHHTIFIDKKIPLGLDWGKWIRERIGESDFVVAFLTAQSVVSEMVLPEIKLAHELAKTRGRPRIIPVRSFEKGRQVSVETTRMASQAFRNPMLKTASQPPAMAISALPPRTIQKAWPMA